MKRFPSASLVRSSFLRSGIRLCLFGGACGIGPLLLAQNQAPHAMPPQESEGPTLGEVIGAIAENESRQASDYAQLAQITLQLGQAGLQQGQRIPDPSIWDGIHAVEAGQAMDPSLTDWDTLKTELEKLLEKPPEQEQQEGEDQNQDQQNSENQDSQDQGEQQNSDQGENEDSQNQNNQGDPDRESDPQQNDHDNMEDSRSEQRSEGQDANNQRPQPNQNLGDMDTPEQTPELDQQREPQEEQQTQVGGEENQQPIRSAKQAMTLQQLEQIKQQDKPGALHMLLQQAEQQEKGEPQKLQKDW